MGEAIKKLKKEVAELEKQLWGIMEKVNERGAPTVSEKARIMRLFKEWQAKLAIMRGVPKGEAYRQAEEATRLLSESMCIVVEDE